MRDCYLLLTPILLLGVLGLVRFVGCDIIFRIDHVDPPPASPTTFLTSQTLMTPRNDYAGFAGMAITVGSKSLKVQTLQRYCIPGSARNHTIEIIDAQNNTQLPSGVAAVSLAGKPEGFEIGALTNEVILSAGKTYYIVSQEDAGGDQFYDNDTAVVVQPDATVVSPVYQDDTGQWVLLGAQDHSYGPVNFTYLLS